MAEAATPLREQPTGRVDAGQEAIIKSGEVKKRLDDLKKLYTSKQDAAVLYREAIKKAAEAAGINAKPLRDYVNALCNEKSEQRRRDAEQLELLFAEVGE